MNISKFKFKNLGQYLSIFINTPSPIRNFVGFVLVFTKTSDYFKIKRNGYILIFHPTALSLSFFVNVKSRSDDEDVLEKFLKKGDTYVDVGANIGSLVLKAASIVGVDGKVYGIEAHPKIFNFLNENVNINSYDNIVLINSAVGDQQGELFFTDRNADDQNYVTTDKNGIKVLVSTLDLLIDLEKIDFLKIDVEGYEKFVLNGASKTLERTKIILIEVSDENFIRYGYKSKEILQHLMSFNFNLFSTDKMELINIENNFLKTTNIIGIKK